MSDQPNEGGQPGTVTSGRTTLEDAMAVSRQRRQGNAASQGQPAQAAASSPAPVAPASRGGAPVPQPAEARDSVSLTGEETAEQLASLGITSPNAHERIRELGREKNEAVNQLKLQEAQMNEIRARMEAMEARGGKGEPEPTPPKREIPIPPYEVPFPEEGSYQEQEDWKLDKRIYEQAALIARKELSAFVPELGKYLNPIMENHARSEREAAWGEVVPHLEKMGVKRSEVENTVHAMLQQNPALSLQGAVWQAVAYENIPIAERVRQAAAPQSATPPDAISTPGSGRTSPTPPPRKDENPLEALQRVAQEAQGQGRVGLANFFGEFRRAGAINVQAPGQVF